MSSGCSKAAGFACAVLLAACGAHKQSAGSVAAHSALTVCADPNNLPFSNRAGQGFENRIAEVVADELGMPLQYLWWPQRRGFARNTLNSGACDLIAGVQAGFELAATTQPYYVSRYVFVSRAEMDPPIRSFDDARLRTLRIGIHAVGDDYASVPPALELAARGIVGNLRGYSIHGDYSQPDPPARLIEAVAEGHVDVAIAWGPLAGYFAQRAAVPLQVVPVPAEASVPMQFAIAMAVRREDPALLAQVDRALRERRPQIDAILRGYGVPFDAMESTLAARGVP